MSDAAGFEEFYQGSRQRVLAFIYLRTNDLSEAQDVVQEAYMKAWQHWPSIDRHDNPEAWLRLVANRIAMSRWRRMRNRARAYLRHGPDDPLPEPSVNTVAVVAALRQLPEEQRTAIAMHYLLGLPVADVARETGAPIGTVKARLHRGRAALAMLMAPEPTEAADV
ncbi:SigE family RNA polymerase sigma factor [Actinoplanes sp. NBRC 103695]|uniref:RNA polymerase sigma factor n=1 Tax=Actinoplanes sp. NBRC 103695 TaxID=3032202 RepID=UPI0024A20F44|nr:SigE family RNA polymerase sigma factor [Actinoplanes sp. NBRC 103695]GLZ02484.1 RNA polymerase sigma24 factor [Actinoplanes sp. NBRC 103695]